MTEKMIKKKKKIIRITGIILACAVAVMNFSAPARALRRLPDAVFADSENAGRFSGFLLTDSKQQSGNTALTAALLRNESLAERKISLKPLHPLFLREIPVYTDKRSEFYPCGDVIGISIKTKGVLIVGSGSFINSDGRKRCPAQAAGLKPGDIILDFGGRKVSTAEELQSAVNASGTETDITIERNGQLHSFRIKPEICENGSAMIGAWVRDSAVGIGTLSFIEKDTGKTAALGHAVVDADTGKIISVRGGRMVMAKVLGVLKGEAGEPGELQGTFFASSEFIGSIENNTDFGLYGRLAPHRRGNPYKEALPIAFPDEVHRGGAYILSAVGGNGIRRYECRIIRAAAQTAPEPKGLVIEITDDRLLDSTGGIVQGMSGSPIIQDGRLAGVVTHVFINDPKKGYGIYAYWMYRMMNGESGSGC